MKATRMLKFACLTIIALLVLLLFRPFGVTFNWVIYSLLMSALLIAALFLEFEDRSYDSRMIALVSMLTAIVVASRQMLHGIEFSPVFFIVILVGYSYGFIPGFTVGALSMFLSNFFLGQGPWTPFQMIGLGFTGGLASILPKFRNRKAEVIVLASYSIVTAYLYGAFTDLFSWIAFVPQHTIETFLAIVSAGMPANTSRAAGNILFTVILGPPLLRVFERFRRRFTVKYIDIPRKQ
ncbi:MAG: ECF transporter S component [Candidatus Altiarchaeota archaeon]|nr:ECF transporter S component [Candidatus Altiarchaeota archaeon]